MQSINPSGGRNRRRKAITEPSLRAEARPKVVRRERGAKEGAAPAVPTGAVPAGAEARIAELEERVRGQQAVLDNIADAVVVADRHGKLSYFNNTAEVILGLGVTDESPEGWSARYGIYCADRVTVFPSSRLPLARALQGEIVLGEEMFVRHMKTPEGTWISASARPIRREDGTLDGAVVVFRDIGDRKCWEQEIQRQLELEKERNETLERMRDTIRELSTPILEVWHDVLVMPLIGVVDSQRSAEMTEALLDEVARKQCRFVIIDITGVELVDSSTADRLIKLVGAVELLGARCMLTGIRPTVAQTLTSLGIDLGPRLTFRNLRQGLEACLRLERGEPAARARGEGAAAAPGVSRGPGRGGGRAHEGQERASAPAISTISSSASVSSRQ